MATRINLADCIYQLYNLAGFLLCVGVPASAALIGFWQRNSQQNSEDLAWLAMSSGMNASLLLILFWLISAVLLLAFRLWGLPRLNALAFTVLCLWMPIITTLFPRQSNCYINFACLVSLCPLIPLYWLGLRQGRSYTLGILLEDELDTATKYAAVCWIPAGLIAAFFSRN